MEVIFYFLASTPFVLMMYIFFIAKHYKEYLAKKPIIYIMLGLALTIYPAGLLYLGDLLPEVVLGQSISEGLEVLSIIVGMSLMIFVPISILFILLGLLHLFTRGKIITPVTIFKAVLVFFVALLLLLLLLVLAQYLYSAFV